MDQWEFQIGSVKAGPYSSAQIQHLIVAGKISDEQMIKQVGTAESFSVSDLKTRFAGTAPQPASHAAELCPRCKHALSTAIAGKAQPSARCRYCGYPDELVLEPAPPPAHVAYDKRLQWVSFAFALSGAILGIVVFWFIAAQGVKSVKSAHDLYKAVAAPLLMGSGGLVYGIALMCLFASDEFLAGPCGQKHMRKIGVRKVRAARIVCGIFVAFPFITVAAFLLYAYMS